MATDMPTRHRTRVESVSVKELLAEVGSKLDAFERDYDVRSEQMDTAFDEDCANESLAQWRSLYITWRSLGGPLRS